jgi:protease-4
MSMTADQIVDRRRIRRKLTFWRVVAFLAVLVLIGGAIVAFGNGGEAFPRAVPPQIARVSITGFIGTDRRQREMLDRIAETDAVKGVIVAIDSTGGSTTGGEELYEGLRRLAAKKPTVAAVGTVGASAAYMAAIATDRIFVRRTSLTGSIGVLFQYPELSGLIDKLGVRVEEQKSGTLKAEPTFFRPASDEAKQMIAGLIDDSFNWFVDIVAERRQLPRPDALALADGRIFTGGQALAAKLADEIGGEDAAVAWLATKGVDEDLPVRDWQPRQDRPWYSFGSDAFIPWVARILGLAPDPGTTAVLDQILPENLMLDGLKSVWQASPQRDQ